jgi:hypothetical protein
MRAPRFLCNQRTNNVLRQFPEFSFVGGFRTRVAGAISAVRVDFKFLCVQAPRTHDRGLPAWSERRLTVIAARRKTWARRIRCPATSPDPRSARPCRRELRDYAVTISDRSAKVYRSQSSHPGIRSRRVASRLLASHHVIVRYGQNNLTNRAPAGRSSSGSRRELDQSRRISALVGTGGT